MKDSLMDAHSELRRVDHLIHVSLKYTRTVDVLISVLKRFISCIDLIIQALLIRAKNEGKIEEFPESPIGKVKKLQKLYEDPVIQEMLEEYSLFRRLVRAEYTKRNEFRRYVTMSADDGGTIIEIDIDRVVEYYDNLKEYYAHVHDMVE